MRGKRCKLYTGLTLAAQPSALLLGMFVIAVLGGIGVADAAASKTLTLLPPLSADATTRDVFLNSTSKIQLCVRFIPVTAPSAAPAPESIPPLPKCLGVAG